MKVLDLLYLESINFQYTIHYHRIFKINLFKVFL